MAARYVKSPLIADSMALRMSEETYFRAGSINRRIFGGELSIAEGFETLSAGCVLHGVHQSVPEHGPEDWLSAVEAKFAANRATFCRFYVSGNVNERCREVFTSRGYRQCTEVGLIADPIAIARLTNQPVGHIMPVVNDDLWRWKKSLYRAAKMGPDGHDMQQGLYSEFERLKCDHGYMISFLYFHDCKFKGVVSLAIANGFARLKNLLVHPAFRRTGVARKIIPLLAREAIERGAHSLGVYAAANGPSHRLYVDAGMNEILRQEEWSKRLPSTIACD